MTKTLTIKQLSAELGEDVVYVTGLVKVLVNQGVIKEVGKAPKAEGERGRASTIYEVPNEAVLVFWNDEENKTEQNPPETAVNAES